MPNEIKIDQVESPLGVKGLVRTQEGPSGEEPNPQEIVLSPEEFAQQFGNVRVRYNINGQEVVRKADDLLKRDQLYDGRERTIEERNTQTARLIQELQELRQSQNVQPAAPAKPADPDDPTVFVENVIEKRMTPEMKALKEEINTLRQTLAPVFADANFKAAKEYVGGLGVDNSDFDARRTDVLSLFENQLGRKILPNEIGKINARAWADGYLAVKIRTPAKPEKIEPEKPRPRVVVAGAGPQGGSGSGTNSGVSRSLKDAIEGKTPWAEHLKTKIKPGSITRPGQ